jgi:hypothetical protein
VDRGSSSAIATGMAGLALLIPASAGVLIAGVPTIGCPFPTLTVAPGFLLSNFGLWNASVAVPTLYFFLWNPGLLRGENRVPGRSYVLFIIRTLLTVAYFFMNWKWGLQYQGAQFTHVVCAVNAVWIALLALAFSRSWKQPLSFGYSLLLHWVLFAWLAWYAFPYLGELP